MVSAYADKLSGLFDRRFLLAYWAPVSVCAVLTVLIIGAFIDVNSVLDRWNTLGPLNQTLLGSLVLVLSFASAYVLEALTSPIVRFYEGYNWPALLGRWAKARYERDHRRLQSGSVSESKYVRAYFQLPMHIQHVQPTRLGNILRAAEEYSTEVYELDAVVWWPRLSVLLPDVFNAKVDAAITPMYALLNMASLLSLLAIIGGTAIISEGSRVDLFLLTFLGGLYLARLCYNAAAGQATRYGNMLRIAFDLYRTELLKAMRIELPRNAASEALLWRYLTDVVYRYDRASDFRWPPEPGSRELSEFAYQAAGSPSTETADKQLEISIFGVPVLTLKHKVVASASTTGQATS